MLKRLSIFLISASLLVLSAHIAFASDAPDVIKLKKDTEISRGMIVNDVIVVDGNVTIWGTVEKNVVVVWGSAILKPGSSVKGDVIVVGGEVMKDPAAQIGGKVSQVFVPHFVPSITSLVKGGWVALWAAVSIMALMGFLGLAVLLSALIPGHMVKVVDSIARSYFTTFLWGAFWIIMIAPVAVLLAISIVGIILIPLEILLVALAFIIGYIGSAIYIGKNVIISFRKTPLPFVDAIVGIVILFLVGFIPVVGPVIKVVFLVTGFGAVMTTRFGTIK